MHIMRRQLEEQLQELEPDMRKGMREMIQHIKNQKFRFEVMLVKKGHDETLDGDLLRYAKYANSIQLEIKRKYIILYRHRYILFYIVNVDNHEVFQRGDVLKPVGPMNGSTRPDLNGQPITNVLLPSRNKFVFVKY